MGLPQTETGQPAGAETASPTPIPDAAGMAAAAIPANMLAHISMRGNVLGQAGDWLGEPGSGLAIEALLLAPAAEGPPHSARRPSISSPIRTA